MSQPAVNSKLPPPTFSVLVQMLATQALAAMGAIKIPGQPDFKADLNAAKHMIDMLGVLEEKTKGNLAADEQRLLDTAMHQLRVTFLELQKK